MLMSVPIKTSHRAAFGGGDSCLSNKSLLLSVEVLMAKPARNHKVNDLDVSFLLIIGSLTLK